MMNIQEQFSKALEIPEEPDLGTLYDNSVREGEDRLYIDGIVYEILNGYEEYAFLYNPVSQIVNDWAKANGGDYWDFETPSIITIVRD